MAEPTNETASMPGWSRMPLTTSTEPLTRLTTPSGSPPCSCDQVEHQLLRQRHLLRRLEDEGVAAGDRERQEPERHHRREVERARSPRRRRPAGGTSRSRRRWRRSRAPGPAWSAGRRSRPRPSRSRGRPRRARPGRSCPSRGSPPGPARPGAASSTWRKPNSQRARSIVERLRQAGKAARAAATAASTSSAPDSGTRASTSPVAGLVTSSMVYGARPARQSPSM